MSEFHDQIARYRAAIEAFLQAQFCQELPQKRLFDAMRYSLLAGGKRIRPFLTLAFCRAHVGDEEAAVPFACAIESLHSYSLIHDDMPCLDGDTVRRGAPTNHVRYGEGTAMLAGDGMQAKAFSIAAENTHVGADAALDALRALAHAAGPDGMVGGQMLDLIGESRRLSRAELLHMNTLKTCRFISVACELGSLGHEVLALDNSEENVQHIADSVTQAVCGDAQDESVLTSLGVRNFDCCVVAIGTDIEASILVTVMLKELGAKQVVCKALSALHARVLERVGADRVIQPEKEIGQRLAQHLGRTNVIDYIGFSDDFSILEIKTPRSWIGKTIGQLGVRAKYGINVLAIRHGEGGVTDVTPGADGLISENDLLVILGTNDKVDKVVELK